MLIIKGSQRQEYPRIFDELHRLRYQIFINGRKWSLPSRNEQEFDQYDVDDAAYFFDLTPTGQIAGSLRLTQTHKHSLLADYYSHLATTIPAPRDPNVYESTRYIVQPIVKSPEENRKAKARLIAAAIDWCGQNGATSLQSVIDIELLPAFTAMAPRVKPMGLPHPYGGGRGVVGGGEALAITVKITDETLADVLRYGDLSASDIARAA